MATDPRMSVVRNGSLNEAFLSAFGQGSAPQGAPAPFALDDRTQEQPAPQSAPLPSAQTMSAGAARFLALPREQQAAELESMAMELGRESSARARAEARIRELESHPSAQLAALKRGTF